MFDLIFALKTELKKNQVIELRLFDELICNIRPRDKITCFNKVLYITRPNGVTLIPLDKVLMVRRVNHDDLL